MNSSVLHKVWPGKSSTNPRTPWRDTGAGLHVFVMSVLTTVPLLQIFVYYKNTWVRRFLCGKFQQPLVSKLWAFTPIPVITQYRLHWHSDNRDLDKGDFGMIGTFVSVTDILCCETWFKGEIKPRFWSDRWDFLGLPMWALDALMQQRTQ